MGKIIFLATYLRSGSTWLRFLLANLFYRPVETSAEIDRMIPEIPELGSLFMPLPTDRDLLVKTHLPLSRALVTGRKVTGALYLVRDPFDVTVSLANFYLRGLEAIERRNDEQIENARQHFINHMLDWGAPPPCFRDGVGTWTNHVASWLCDNPVKIPILLVRYEDLLANPEKELRRICASIDLEVNAERLRHAIERSSWDSMKRLEEHEIRERTDGIFFNQVVRGGVEKGFRFLYRGTRRTALKVLTDEQMERGVATFSPIMQRLHYGPPASS